MPTTLLEPRTFTVDEFHAMAEAGLFDEDRRVELIDGQIITMSPIGGPHIACLSRLTELFVARKLETGGAFTVSVQNPLRLGPRQEPQPDLALLRPMAEERVPEAADVLLVVEVADTTLATDRAVKAPRYAAAGLPELWIVNLPDGRVEVYRRPGPGGYGETRTSMPGEHLSVEALPEVAEVAVAEVLGR